MATHSSILAWRIPGMGEPGGLPSIGLHRVGHDWSDLAAASEADWWVRPEGWLRLSAHSLGAALYQDHGQYPAFVPGTSLRSGSCSGAFLYLIVPNFPQLHMCAVIFIYFLYVCAVILVPYSFFVFCSPRSSLSRCQCKHPEKGSQVPLSHEEWWKDVQAGDADLDASFIGGI